MTGQPTSSTRRISEGDHFEVGGDGLLEAIHTALTAQGDDESSETANKKRHETLSDIRIRIGTLLKAETVSFLLGAGVSVDCGGPLLGKVSLDVERAFQVEDICAEWEGHTDASGPSTNTAGQGADTGTDA